MSSSPSSDQSSCIMKEWIEKQENFIGMSKFDVAVKATLDQLVSQRAAAKMWGFSISAIQRGVASMKKGHLPGRNGRPMILRPGLEKLLVESIHQKDQTKYLLNLNSLKRQRQFSIKTVLLLFLQFLTVGQNHF